MFPIMDAVGSVGELDNIGGSSKYSKNIMFLDGCIIFMMNAKKLENDNFYKGKYFDYLRMNEKNYGGRFMVSTNMKFVKLTKEYFEELKELQIAYKLAIEEKCPDKTDFESLYKAIERKKINFYGCLCDEKLIACCSICFTYSTFAYQKAGVFEDFYIKPEFRHQGVAKQLVKFAYETSGVHSLIVGCAECDLEIYKAIGFTISLGNMLAYNM
jgi:GNAT superfamily N-acetyltransferase